MSREPPACRSDWEGRYRAGDAPWDLGRAPPCLEALVDALAGPRLRVFVPGAGRGHDARCWARAGHAVTALDIAPTAVAQGRVLTGDLVTWIVGDLFALPRAMHGAFDVVWEQTCLCALPPERRADYARAVASVLRPGGVFHGVLWEHGKEGGPPWSITMDVARDVLGGALEIERMERIPDWSEQRWNEFTVRARESGPRPGRGAAR
jgi:SAM-dependent methyltransferase